jgi:hypothetical protein
MKVKIIKCSGNEYWYKDKIGKVYKVKKYNDSDYILKSNKRLIIKQYDCIVIKPEKITLKIHEDDLEYIMNIVCSGCTKRIYECANCFINLKRYIKKKD